MNLIEQWRANPDTLLGRAYARVTQDLTLCESTSHLTNVADVIEQTFKEAERMIIRTHDLVHYDLRHARAPLPERDSRAIVTRDIEEMNRIAIRYGKELEDRTITQILKFTAPLGIFGEQPQPTNVVGCIRTIFSNQKIPVRVLCEVLHIVVMNEVLDCLNDITLCGRFDDIPVDDLRVALKCAAENGRTQVILKLLTKGVQFSQADKSMAVLVAAKNGHLRVVQELLAQGRSILGRR